MHLLANFTAALVLACVALQVLQGDCHRDAGRPARDRGRAPLVSDGGTEGRRVFKGTFGGRDGARCGWRAAGGDTAVLSVKCGSGPESIACRYTARPALCPQFRSDAKAYWKQIGRALKNQESLCRDPKALIKAGMCRKAPRSGQFRLHSTERRSEAGLGPGPGAGLGAGPEPTSAGGTSCTEKIDGQKLAEEYCNEAWSGFCTFFFAVVQSEDC